MSAAAPGPGPHLDAPHWCALQAREPGAAVHFARHLAAPCEVCEAFLAQGPDALEALADEALVAVSTAAPAAEDTLGWERVRRRLAPPRARRWAPALAGLGLAAAAALALVVLPTAPHTGGSGARLKGTLPLVLELTAVAQLPDGSVGPVSSGTPLPPRAVVLLRYHASEPARALLVRRREGAASQVHEEVLGTFHLEPGTHDLRDASGALAGVSLEDERGGVVLTLVGVAGTGPDTPDAARLKQAAGQPGATRSQLRLQVHAGP